MAKRSRRLVLVTVLMLSAFLLPFGGGPLFALSACLCYAAGAAVYVFYLS
jgi:hypothetical protein